MYGSSNTLKLVSDFQGYNYLNLDKADDKPQRGTANEYTIMTLSYATCIIASLKHDFSGYEINPLYLLKIKLNDFEPMRDIFEKTIDGIIKKID